MPSQQPERHPPGVWLHAPALGAPTHAQALEPRVRQLAARAHEAPVGQARLPAAAHLGLDARHVLVVLKVALLWGKGHGISRITHLVPDQSCPCVVHHSNSTAFVS